MKDDVLDQLPPKTRQMVSESISVDRLFLTLIDYGILTFTDYGILTLY